eukprot:TRINITY_DN1159_c0_g1_i2.p1 TRINITY_DN1159_c0_g1~~TRINITY_DN1159_c0_g1_i2.p1  ORF type:complete len:449 (+),score=137.39 TRINITY_DN1159_c0_g1_i2:224-1570(+)
MSQLSNLIGFWNNKSTEAEKMTRPKPRQEAIKTRKVENRIVSNPVTSTNDMERSVSGSAGSGHRKVKDLPLDRAGERGKVPGKTAPDILAKVGPENKSDKNDAKECMPEKWAGLDLKSGHQDTTLRSASPLQPRAVQDKPVSPFAKFKQMENDQASSKYGSCSSPPSPLSPRMTNLSRNSSLPSSPRPTLTHAQLSAPGTVAARSGSGAKEIILGWVQQTLKDYPIPMTNFSSCFSNGLAFCALIHAFYPDSFDWNSLKAENRKYNFTLGFEAAEVLAGISPLLEVEDMVRYDRPDWKCVFCYIQSFYRRFRNVSNPTQAHVITIPAHTQEYKQNDKVITRPQSSTTTTKPVKEPSSPNLVRESSPPKMVTEPPTLVTSSQTPEEQTPTMNTKSTLHPTSNVKTATRSKSVSSDQPRVADMAKKERKYSFNHPLSTDTTHLVSFNTRQ